MDLTERMQALVGTKAERPQVGRHPVNEPMIAHWCDAMGDANPRYAAEGVAPAAMLDVWDRPGLPAARRPDLPRAKVLGMLDEAGYVSTVASNSELELVRELRVGELVHQTEILEEVTPEKATALGVGHFLTTRHRYETVDGEHVGDLLFRILKFKPGTGRAPTSSGPDKEGTLPAPDPDPKLRPKPATNRDNAFVWEGYRAHELRIQRCVECGGLHNPPTPRCWHCGSFSMGYVVAGGGGTLYSHAVPHYPQGNGFRYPVVVGLIELDEGVRVLANVAGCNRDQLRIGMPLELGWLDEADPPLPQFRPATPATRTDTRTRTELSEGDELPLFAVPITATLIVSGALATRDYTQVHHDRDIAIARGSKDIFPNINTSVGLLARYVVDWAGPDVRFRSIKVRLGVPAYPGHTLSFSGKVVTVGDAVVVVGVRGVSDLGDHVTGTVELELP